MIDGVTEHNKTIILVNTPGIHLCLFRNIHFRAVDTVSSGDCITPSLRKIFLFFWESSYKGVSTAPGYTVVTPTP